MTTPCTESWEGEGPRPVLGPDEVHVWRLVLDRPDDQRHLLASLLSADERDGPTGSAPAPSAIGSSPAGDCSDGSSAFTGTSTPSAWSSATGLMASLTWWSTTSGQSLGSTWLIRTGGPFWPSRTISKSGSTWRRSARSPTWNRSSLASSPPASGRSSTPFPRPSGPARSSGDGPERKPSSRRSGRD